MFPAPGVLAKVSGAYGAGESPALPKLTGFVGLFDAKQD